MLLALVTARLAGGSAGLQDRAGQVDAVAGVPGQHPPRADADVCAVEIGADALDQLGDRLIAQKRVRAGGARLGRPMVECSALLQVLLFVHGTVPKLGVAGGQGPWTGQVQSHSKEPA